MALLAFFFCQRLIWLLALVVWNGSQYSQSSLLSWILKGVEFASIGYTLLLYMNFTLWSGRRGKRFSHWFCFWNDSLFDLFFNFILISKKAEIRIFIVVEYCLKTFDQEVSCTCEFEKCGPGCEIEIHVYGEIYATLVNIMHSSTSQYTLDTFRFRLTVLLQWLKCPEQVITSSKFLFPSQNPYIRNRCWSRGFLFAHR